MCRQHSHTRAFIGILMVDLDIVYMRGSNNQSGDCREPCGGFLQQLPVQRKSQRFKNYILVFAPNLLHALYIGDRSLLELLVDHSFQQPAELPGYIFIVKLGQLLQPHPFVKLHIYVIFGVYLIIQFRNPAHPA
ncbi:hypothetical protein D3C85_1565160 [compost metagenome]